jgi:hypothetical protein
MVAVLKEPAVVVTILAALKFAFEVVIARRTLLIEVGFAPMFDDFLDPPFFGLRGRI